jgi:hypothetical protein
MLMYLNAMLFGLKDKAELLAQIEKRKIAYTVLCGGCSLFFGNYELVSCHLAGSPIPGVYVFSIILFSKYHRGIFLQDPLMQLPCSAM